MRVWLTLLIACLAIVSSPGGYRVGHAAVLQGFTVSGVTVDPAGGAVPGVAVELRQASAPTRRTVTDAQGRWTFDKVVAGQYEIRAMLAGFRTSVMTLNLTAAPAQQLRIVLQIGDVTETVTVTSAAETISRQSALGAAGRGASVNGLPQAAPAPPPPGEQIPRGCRASALDVLR
jgi:hypothetical protein